MNFNKLWFPRKPVDVQLGTIPENTRIGDCYQQSTINVPNFMLVSKGSQIFRVMPSDYGFFLVFRPLYER